MDQPAPVARPHPFGCAVKSSGRQIWQEDFKRQEGFGENVVHPFSTLKMSRFHKIDVTVQDFTTNHACVESRRAKDVF